MPVLLGRRPEIFASLCCKNSENLTCLGFCFCGCRLVSDRFPLNRAARARKVPRFLFTEKLFNVPFLSEYAWWYLNC